MRLQEKQKELEQETIANLCAISKMPKGLLPHTVYVEEEGEDADRHGVPVYTMYRLEEIRPDGSCSLRNSATGEYFPVRQLYEINIDWLLTVWNRYVELCTEQHLPPIQDVDEMRTRTKAKSLYAFVWSCNLFGRDVPDEKLIETWENGASRSLNDEEDESLYEVERLTPDELAERINDECFNDTEDYVRFIEMEE